jgi:hypothetical protein
MMSKILTVLIIVFGLTARSEISPSLGECSSRIQGGVDVFPWSAARPFPWNNIQGVWQLKEGLTPTYLKARVTRTTSNRKIIDLTIISNGNCAKPVARGVGFIDVSEKNVVRAIMNDGVSKYQMKIALFDIKDLVSDTNGCDESIMAASLQVFGSLPPSPGVIYPPEYSTESTQNIMLKKVSDDLISICKKTSMN